MSAPAFDLKHLVREALLEALRTPEVRDEFRAILGDIRTRDPDEWLTLGAAAAELHLTSDALRKRIERGQLHAERIGKSRTWRIRRRDLVKP